MRRSSPAQLLNRAELARDVGIAPSKAGEWLSVVEASGLCGFLVGGAAHRFSLAKVARR